MEIIIFYLTLEKYVGTQSHTIHHCKSAKLLKLYSPPNHNNPHIQAGTPPNDQMARSPPIQSTKYNAAILATMNLVASFAERYLEPTLVRWLRLLTLVINSVVFIVAVFGAAKGQTGVVEQTSTRIRDATDLDDEKRLPNAGQGQEIKCVDSGG
ncbi:uncharacterized protein BDW43DRAFT_309371 [Aspergillus alliaceus]|uniref:uncharacterized protein n=1 Tax=Petromyces alliaceus TaxID=209559 RepID=UPI0012A47F90|nr:uncharacterized protein BDW43DRAFT_309371 [Aspergillus alliaceus]KAB8235506.1 hypothetical protein BDW43DRAFT_309371 [Aspergillus alliaceus]